MKKKKLNWIYKSILAIVIGLSLIKEGVLAQTMDKTIEKTVNISDNTQIISTNINGADLTIKNWEQDKIKVIYKIQVKAKNAENLKAFNEELENKLNKQFEGSHDKSLNVSFPLKNYNQKDEHVSIKFQNGKIKHRLAEFKLETIIYAPKKNPLILIHSFNKLIIEGERNDLTLILSSCNFSMGNCNKLKLSTNFCKNVKIGNINEADLNIQSGGISTGVIENSLIVKANFANIEVSKINGNASLDISSSTFKSSNIKELKLSGSFIREFKANNIEKTVIKKLSSSEFVANNINALTIEDASFSTFRVAQIETLSIEKSSSSKFYVTAANVVEAPQCSFTDFSIGQLKKRFVTKSSSGSIKLDDVITDFEKISIDGQFVNININTQENASYKIEAELEFPNYRFHDITYSLKEKNLSNEKMSGIRGTDKNTNSKISFDCKSCSITLD